MRIFTAGALDTQGGLRQFTHSARGPKGGDDRNPPVYLKGVELAEQLNWAPEVVNLRPCSLRACAVGTTQLNFNFHAATDLQMPASESSQMVNTLSIQVRITNEEHTDWHDERELTGLNWRMMESAVSQFSAFGRPFCTLG